MPMHKTSAWPLAQVYLGLIVYASLYPFTQWRDQGVTPWLFMLAPLPRYWSGFDVVANVLGYMPLGFFLALSALRTGKGKFAFRFAVLVALSLSFTMESLQVYLPSRVPSNLDLVLNIAGAALGALSAWALEKLGFLQGWSRFRASWFVGEARGALVLLALWPMALLFPTASPFGLGHVMVRLEAPLAQAFVDIPFLQWLPLGEFELPTVAPMVEWWCVVLGVLMPGLLGYCVIQNLSKRIWFLLWVAVLGGGATALSSALSFGPEHAWAWLTEAVLLALACAGLGLAVLLRVPPRGAAAFAVLGLGIYLSLINQVPSNPYFEQTLFMWEQGRFIRFHGLAQWLGWVWPFAALVYVMALLWRKETKT
jgi:VanZ family protein